MTRATQHHEILWPFVPVVVVAVVMNVKRRVVAAAHLAPVSGSRKRLHPPHLPLWLLPVLGSHLVQLGSPCLLSEASSAALLVVEVHPEFGAPPAQQGCGHHLTHTAFAERFQFSLEAAQVPRILREDLLVAVEAPEQEDRLCLGDGPRLSAVDSERMVQPGDRDLIHLREEAYEVRPQLET